MVITACDNTIPMSLFIWNKFFFAHTCSKQASPTQCAAFPPPCGIGEAMCTLDLLEDISLPSADL